MYFFCCVFISSQASQQNLFRTLTALSNLTGGPKCKNAAKEAIAYMFKNYRSKNGLLYWGGHTFVDLGPIPVFTGLMPAVTD